LLRVLQPQLQPFTINSLLQLLQLKYGSANIGHFSVL